jgi:hypothetical protein
MALLDKVSGELNLYIGGYVFKYRKKRLATVESGERSTANATKENANLTVIQVVHSASKGIASRSWYHPCAFCTKVAGGARSF